MMSTSTPAAFTMMAAVEEYYIFTGGVVPRHVTRVRIHESISVIPARAFYQHPNITELYCHDAVKKVEEYAFRQCRSLRIVIMRGVKAVDRDAFFGCAALAHVECGELKIIGHHAFAWCNNLRSFNLPSIKIVEGAAFVKCAALTNIKFGNKLDSIRWSAFAHCTSLERSTLPLKDGMITDDNVFQGCENLKRVVLIEGDLHETITALLLEEWKKDMNEEIESIKQILPTTPAGSYENVGGKAVAIRVWITNVLHKIIHYKAEHNNYLKEATITLELALWKKRLSEINISEGDEEGRASCRVKCGADIVMKNVLPFLELPPYTFGEEY
eukprot:scaffold21639_cov77-Skeletonema_dohrnii-CCMP3373.AAC.2